MKEKLCYLCLQPEFHESEASVDEQPSGKTGNEIIDLALKIFGVKLDFGLMNTEKDIICIKCDKYLEIAHVMHETVVKAQKHLSRKKFIVVAPDGEIVAESVGLDSSFFVPEIKEEIHLEHHESTDIAQVLQSSHVKTETNVTKIAPKTGKSENIAKIKDEHPNIDKNKSEPVQSVSKSTEELEDERISKFFSLTCCYCPDLTFPKFHELKTHMQTEHNEKWCYVTCCNFKLDKKHKLLEHITYHQDPDKFKCPVCGRQFASMEKLQNHNKSIHGPKEDLRFECKDCGKRFLKGCTLKTHSVIHLSKEERDALNAFECNECGYRCDSRFKLVRHMEQVHLNMHLFVCDICAKVYKTKSQYEYHQSLVHSDKPLKKKQCHICQNFFMNQKNLQAHIRSMHLDQQKEHICDICGKVSKSIRAMRNHKRYMHKVERKFVCTICDKGFKEAGTLKEHMTVHLGGTLYGCLFCERTFNSKANMYSHRKKMHPVELENLKQEKKRKDLEGQ